jgi:cation transport regulator
MPYKTNDELPNPVKNNLPEHAQTIFRATFNDAYKEYKGEEVRAMKVAWAAVKKEYEKNAEGKWVKKN